MAIKKDGVGNDRLTFRAQAFQPGGCDCDTPGYEDEVGNDNVVDLSCSDSVKVLRTLPMELTDEERDIVREYLKISDITRAYIAANGHLFIVMNDGTERDVGDARGIPGDTPEFGDNGNWFIGGKDTGVPTTGPQGDTPYIGENGNWWVSGKDLGIRTGKPKLGDIMESLQHPGAGWVACDDGVEAPGTPLYEALPYNTEWRKVPTEKAGLPPATAFKPLPVAGQWYYMQKYTGSGSYGDEAFVYDANTDTIVTFSCPSVSNATKSYGMTGLTHDGDRYVLCVAEMQISASMTGVTHFFTSTNLEDWEYQASFNARSTGYFATDLCFDGTYLLVIEHYGYGEQQEYVVRFDKALSKRTELKGIGTDSHSFITLPAGYWSYATTSDKYVTVYGSGSTTAKFTFPSSHNLGRVAFFNDRYWLGLPVTDATSSYIQVADLTTNEFKSLSVSTVTGGKAGLLANAEYDPNANEWVLYTKTTGARYAVRISADADPTKASSYKTTPISAFPTTLSYEQMKPDRSQMLLSSDSYRLLRDPNLKYRPKSGDNPHYIYAGVGGEAIVAPSMYAVDADAVHYYTDDVTDAQRARARENIGAASVTELNTLREDVDQRIANVPKFSTLVVESLPLRDVSDTTVYLVPTGDGEDLYTEYINVDGKWEKLGTQSVLSVPGEKGDDGITPHIGENGNWWLGEVDTGKPSRGEKGDKGDDASVTAENIEAALGYKPAKPGEGGGGTVAGAPKNVWYGTCTSSSYNNTKYVVNTDTGDFALVKGNVLYVLFKYSSPAGVTLNVDGTGEIQIKAYGTTDLVQGQWGLNEVVGFVYDGEVFRLIDGYLASTSYYGKTKLSSSTSSTAVNLAATPSAVKQAYDLATTANTAAEGAADAAAEAKTAAEGASQPGHTHSKSDITDFPTSMTPTAHNQAASTITAGTFAGQVVAKSSAQTPSTALLRNSKIVSADTTPSSNGEICWTYK